MKPEFLPKNGYIEFDGFLIEKLISEEQIDTRIRELADQIYFDYQGKDLLMIALLKGASMFHSDLMKEFGRGNQAVGREPMPVQIDFMQVNSMDGTNSTGNVKKDIELSTSVTGRHVLIVEDVIDTGITLAYVKEDLLRRNPASLKICTLADKKERRQTDLVPDYVGFDTAGFLVGRGLDYNQYLRNLPFIGVLISTDRRTSAEVSPLSTPISSAPALS